MAAHVLIIDPVATNRIVLRVKMLAAQYDVTAFGSCDDARATLAENRPGLILINLNELGDSGSAFCRGLRDDPETRDIAIVSVGCADSSAARFQALDAGADDVLPRPISDSLLLSRVRSHLRRRTLAHDLITRDGTYGAFGFEQSRAPSLAPARVALLVQDPAPGHALLASLQKALQQPLQMLAGPQMLRALDEQDDPDLFVLHGDCGAISSSALTHMVCEMRARPATCDAALLVIVPQGAQDLAAMLLDLGAGDVAFADATPDEIALRAERLIAAKRAEAHLRDRVRMGLKDAVTDPLTGLFNRRYAETQIDRIASSSATSGRPYAVLMLDIDHFKAINDTHGHAAGDTVLCDIASRLSDILREGDILARVGGEEFLVLLPAANADTAQETAERLRRGIAMRPFVTDDGTRLSVTVSVGVAVHEGQDQRGLSALMSTADTALYSAKCAGRDAVAVAMTVAA